MPEVMYPASRSRASDHWPTEAEWEEVATPMGESISSLEEMMFRLRHTFQDETAPTPTFEDLGVLAMFTHYLNSYATEITGEVARLQRWLRELDDLRINTNVEQSLGELGADDVA
jgi:hypothetical protein